MADVQKVEKAEPVIKTKKLKTAKLHNRTGYGKMPTMIYIKTGKNIQYVRREDGERMVASGGSTFMKRQAVRASKTPR